MKLGPAALLAALAACSPPPAENILHPVDARDMSAASRVEITVYSRAGDGALSTTAQVFFADPDGTWVKEMTVDAKGVAFAYLPEGGSVTVLERSALSLTTIRGVKPGDKLMAGRTFRRFERVGAELHMQPSITLPPGATLANLYGTCLGGTNVSAFLYSACVTPTFGALAIASHSEGDQYLFQPDNTFEVDGPLVLTGTFQPTLTPVVAVSGLRTDVTFVTLQNYAIFDNAPIEVGRADLAPSPGGSLEHAMRYTPLAGHTSMLLVSTWEANGRAPSMHHVAVSASPAVPTTLDAAAHPLPRFVEPKTYPRALTWTESGSGTPDARFVQWDVQWINTQNHTLSVRWEVMEPATEDMKSLLPSLPPAYDLEDPSAPGIELLFIEATPAYVDYDNLAGYDDARPYGFQLREIDRMLLEVEHTAHRSLYQFNVQ